jgi:fused signal recognition particle receptor
VFDLLKKKLSGFVQGIVGKKEEKQEAVPAEKAREEPVFEKPAEETIEERPSEKEEKPVAKVPERKEIPAERKEVPVHKKEEKKAPAPPRKEEEAPPEPEKGPEGAEKKPEPAPRKEIAVGRVAERGAERLEKKVRKDIFAAVKETISGASEIREGEISDLLDELELGLIESDVALEVAEDIKNGLKKRVVGAKVPKGKTAEFIQEQLKETLIGMVDTGKGFSIPERVMASEKPVKIMVLGPNGSGKTTTIAKITKMLQGAGFSVVVAASDTFRAAAVEQMKHHGDKLGIKVISGAYGSDPTALAFDAVEYAKAHKIDVVLIDTAGRQDTNVNLLNQLKKMNRVIAPQIKIYVGESIAGNAIVEQISVFNKEIGMDGVVLTKLDCDAKGGTVVSISKVTGIPIIYVGTGQGYGDLEQFDAKKIIGEILS